MQSCFEKAAVQDDSRAYGRCRFHTGHCSICMPAAMGEERLLIAITLTVPEGAKAEVRQRRLSGGEMAVSLATVRLKVAP